MVDDLNWYGPEAATFGDRLAAARDHAGLTQRALASRLGVQVATLRKWENDMSEPRANRLSMLAGLLNVSMMWLINGEGESVEAPVDDVPVTSDMTDILVELRALRADMLKKAETVGRLEKRLRRLIDPPGEM
ncbi:MAG: helix-turn-helix transcriptional regulator [Pseudomonadota bacterium]